VTRPIGAVARIENVVMGAFDDADGIELDIAEPADQRQQRGSAALLPDVRQSAARQDQGTRQSVGDGKGLGHAASRSAFRGAPARSRMS
jgi:hypothetical protein